MGLQVVQARLPGLGSFAVFSGWKSIRATSQASRSAIGSLVNGWELAETAASEVEAARKTLRGFSRY